MNILSDYNYEKTIQPYEYTDMSIRQMDRILNSEEFKAKDAETIFNFLRDEMKIVPFGNHLKRYLYEHFGFTEPFPEISDQVYQEIITKSFNNNHAPKSFTPTKKKFSAAIKGWLTNKSVTRTTVFLLGFGLRMNDQDVSEFLIKVLNEEDFRMDDPQEVVFRYCFREALPYNEAERILNSLPQKPSFSLTRITFEKIHDERSLKKYLASIQSNRQSDDHQKKAYEQFCTLYKKAQNLAYRLQNFEEYNLPKAEDITEEQASTIKPGDIETILSCGIPRTENGNLQKSSLSVLGEHFDGKRVSRQRISSLLKQTVKVDRFDLITLLFFIYAVEVEPDFPAERYLQFTDHCNEILTSCGMQKLYTVNPYETFILMCLLTDEPLSNYTDIWEMSYRQ